MNKGILFAGCSMTKGYGLWNYIHKDYSGLSVFGKHQHGKKLRFANIVGRQLDTFIIIDEDTSGTDEKSIKFCEEKLSHNGDGGFLPTDIGCLVFQLTYPLRSSLRYKNKKGEDIYIGPFHEFGDIDNLIEFNLTPTEYYDLLKNQILNDLIKLFKRAESFGIQCILIEGTPEYSKLIQNNEYLKDKLLKLKSSKERKPIPDIETILMNQDIGKYGYISNIETIVGKDSHQSIEFHHMIALNIIDKIKNK